MITALSLNPSIDMTISINGFTYGGLNRVLTDRQDAGGKGLNVALALRRLGCESECVGFMQRGSAALFETRLRESGAGWDFIYVGGSTRTNIKLRDDSTRQITEFNQSGRPVSDVDIAKMTELVKTHAQNSDFIVLSGSMPPRCKAGYYRELIDAISDTNCRCVLDADGQRLSEGIEAKPFLIKPNRYELETLTGRKLRGINNVRDAALDIVNSGVNIVAVSLGAEGAFITDGSLSLYASRMDIEVKSTVGAGDSMIAALTAGFEMGRSLEETFKMGVACASAACLTEGTRAFDTSDYNELIAKVQVEKI